MPLPPGLSGALGANGEGVGDVVGAAAGEVAGERESGDWDGAAAPEVSGEGFEGADVSGATLGFDPPGLTLKSNPEEGAGRAGALLSKGVPLSEGAAVANGWAMELAPAVPGVASCANAVLGTKGATITTTVIFASTFESLFLKRFTFMQKAT